MVFSFEISSFIAGLIGGGGIGSFLTYKWQKQQTVKGSGTAVDLSNAKAGGDIVGRDKKS